MRLLELEVRDWRGLTTKLGPFSPRLNLILGPNESGKSRLFQALRFGLFESHKGSAQHKQSLQTWASGDSPFVRITFSVQNIEFEIQKRFLKGASSQLAGGGRTVQGEDAEARLRALLGTREVNARGAALTDLGIWPLLMVGQGESRTTLESHMNADGRGRLQDRLAAEVGVVSISSKGRHLKKLASDEYFRYFTQTGQDAKVLKDARGRLDEARESLRTERDHYTRQAMISEDLADKQSVLIGLGERFRSRKAEAEAAQHNAESARQIRNRQRSAETAQQLADQKVQSLKDRLKNRREADEALARLTKEIADLDDRVRLREQDEKRLDGELQNAEVRLRDAEDKRRDIQQALDALRRENRRKDLTEGLETIGERIKTLDQLEREIIAAVRARAALIQVDTTSLERLKGLDGAVRSAAAQLRGSAVSVVLELKETVEIDGVLHAAGERLTFEVTDNQRIRLGTVADVEIRPSSGSLGKLRSEKQDAERALRAALDELSLADVAHAIRAQAQLSEADVKLGQLRASASVLSSRTLAQLREDQSGLEAELHRLGAPPPPWTGPVSSADDLTEAERAVDIARSELDAAISALAEHRKATATLQGEIAAKRHEHQPLLSLSTFPINSPSTVLVRSKSVAPKETTGYPVKRSSWMPTVLGYPSVAARGRVRTSIKQIEPVDCTRAGSQN